MPTQQYRTVINTQYDRNLIDIQLLTNITDVCVINTQIYTIYYVYLFIGNCSLWQYLSLRFFQSRKILIFNINVNNFLIAQFYYSVLLFMFSLLCVYLVRKISVTGNNYYSITNGNIISSCQVCTCVFVGCHYIICGKLCYVSV